MENTIFFIVPTETKVTYQQMINQNVAIQYETVMNEYWPTKSDHNNELDDPSATITGIMIQIKDVYCILNQDKAESNNTVDNIKYHKEVKCTDSLIDIDSFWRFQNTLTQRMMIFLPIDTYYNFQQI